MSTEKVTYLLELRDKFSKNLTVANKGVARLDKNAHATSISLGKVRNVLVGLGIGMVAKSIFDAGVEMEQTRVAFATFLGDAGKANRVIAELNQFSNITPFDNDAVIKSGRVLLAANIPAEKLTGTLKNIGDVAAGSKVPLTELSSIYSKIMNKGKVQAEELNQLSERGIPILSMLSEKFNVTKEEIFKMGSQGKISSDVISQAFNDMASEGGMFFNMMEKQSETTGGKLSTLKGSLGLLAAELGESANPALSEMIDKLIKLVAYLKENKEGIITVVKWTVRLATAFAAYKATIFATRKAILIYNAVQKAAAITSIFFTKGLKGTRVAMKALNVTMKANPIGLVVGGLTLLVPLLIKMINNSNKLNASQRAINEVNARASKIHAEQASRLRTLEATLKSGNVTQKERGDIINEINKNYGSYLDKLLTEKSTDEDIAAALKEVNTQLLRKAKLQAIQERITTESKKQLELELLLSDKERVRQKATEGFWAKARQFSAGIHFQKERQVQDDIKDLREESKDELKESKKIQQDLIKLQEKELKGIKETGKKTTKGVTPISKGVGLSKGATKTLETGIRAGAPKVINVNINKLVETFNIETKQYKDAPIRVKEEMTKVLLDAMNDAVLLQQ